MRHVFLLGALCAAISANAMRCGVHVVERGFHAYEVVERCGEPAQRTSWVEQYYPYGPARTVDEWTYDLGQNRFRRLLRFENGRLIRISTERKPVRPLGR